MSVTLTGITAQAPSVSVTLTGITVQQPSLAVTLPGFLFQTPDPSQVDLYRSGVGQVQLERKGSGPVTLHRVPDTPQPFGISGDWTLLWRDEFDAPLDPSIWMKLRGLGSGYPHPYSATTDDSAFNAAYATVENSCLQLRWDNTPITVTNADSSTTTYPYTAGMAHTGKGFHFTYGYIEARIWVPNSDGIWPAFWMLPTPVDATWPPEIDMVEWLYNSTTSVIEPHFNVHWKDGSGNAQQMGWKTYGSADAGGSWHVYGMIWQPTAMQIIFDGVAGPAYTGSYVTAQDMYIILSAGVRKGYTPANNHMLVDYVRVWQ